MTTKLIAEKKPASAITRVALFAAYVLSIVAGVWAINQFGIVPILGTDLMAPAAVYVVGVTLVLRDLLQDAAGKRAAIVAIVVGAAASALLNPGLALASGVSFLVAEALDFLVYTPVREHLGRVRGVLISNAVSIPVDSFLFLTMAFGSLAFFPGQVVGKAAGTLFAVALMILVGLRSRRA